MAAAAVRQLVADAAWSTAHYADLAACDTPAEAAFQLRVGTLSTCSANQNCKYSLTCSLRQRSSIHEGIAQHMLGY